MTAGTPPLAVAIAIFVAAGCAKDVPRQNASAEAAPAAPPSYALSDTARYGIGADTAARAVLKRNGIVIDTVDARFGAELVGEDSVLFATVRAGAITEYVLFDGGTRTPVPSIVPDFDIKLSSPSVIEGALLYWGIRRTGNADSVFAVRYEFRRRRLNPLPLPAKLDAVTGAHYFQRPYLDNKEIVFKSPAGEWRFRTPKQ